MTERAPAAAPLGLWAGSARVFELTVGQVLWSRRTIFMALVVGLPVVIATVIRLLVAFDVPLMRVGGTPIAGPVVFGLMIWGFFVRFSVPVLAVFYGTSLIADEVEDRTITYLFTRPLPRGAVLLGKYAAYLVTTASVVLPSVVLVWLLIAPIQSGLASTFDDLLKDLGVLAAGLASYGAVFALAGARLKRPLLVGLIFVFGWESFAMALPGAFRLFTVAHYLEGLVPQALPADSTIGWLQALFYEAPGPLESLTGLALITAGSLWLAMRTVGSREYVLDQ
jgi:ABC-type transport system involved in multi-copper enzyme maturation permease subunit